MNYLSLDLELNQPSNKIIQVGYVVGNILSGEVLYRQTLMVDPQEELNPYITVLTSITPENLVGAGTVLNAYEAILPVADLYEVSTNMITWGGGDHEQFRSQAGLTDTRWRFGRRYTDVKTVMAAYCMANNKKIAGGLSKSMGKLGLGFKGKKHWAEDDAYNTWRIYMELLKRMKYEES